MAEEQIIDAALSASSPDVSVEPPYHSSVLQPLRGLRFLGRYAPGGSPLRSITESITRTKLRILSAKTRDNFVVSKYRPR